MRIRDWSSDVCSSDLRHGAGPVGRMAIEGKAAALDALAQGRGAAVWQRLIADVETPVSAALKLIEPGRGDWVLESVESGQTRGRYSLNGRSEERRVGKECVSTGKSRGAPDH